MSNNDDWKAKLLQAKKDLYNLGAVNTKIDEITRLRDESAARIRQIREAQSYHQRYEHSKSPIDRTPELSSLGNSPESSNESSVDPWMIAEHKRPSTVPREFKGKYSGDRVELVQDLSDREDDPSDGGIPESRDVSTSRGPRKKTKVSEMDLDWLRERNRDVKLSGKKTEIERKRGEKRKTEQ